MRSAPPLLRDDLVEALHHAGVLGGLELDAGLDDVHGGERAVGHGAADPARERTLEEVVHTVLLLGRGHEARGGC